MSRTSMERLRQLAQVFLKLGTIGFGGPAAHLAMMEDEVVQRRGWLTSETFLDLVGATNLIPGPNSTEMAIHVGYLYGGGLGLVVAGCCFLLPAIAITAGLAWVYQQFGTLPQVAPIFAGIQPAVLAIVIVALWRLGKKALKQRLLWLVGVGVVGLLLLGLNPVLALLLGGVLGAIALVVRSPSNPTMMAVGALLGVQATGGAISPSVASPPLWQLGLFFLKVGSVLFGSGYVLIAFLEGELVEKYGWLTQQQLLDAIAIGQFTPGPVSSTATFIGYLIAGFPGAIVATAGIFLPSFLFVALVNPWIPKLRQSKWTAAFLDSVNVSAVALMGVVTLRLAQGALVQAEGGVNWLSVSMAMAAIVSILRWRVNSAWIVLAGAIIGWLFQ